MPASITLSHLGWSTPDGATLFSNLSLSFGAERTGLVGRNGIGKSTLLRLICGECRPLAGTVSISGALGWLPQNNEPTSGETIADLFGARRALAQIARAEAGAATVAELAEIDWTLPARIEAALLRSGLTTDPLTPLASLSGGQVTRARLAALISGEPDFLLLDEPTNNLDRAGRVAVRDLVGSWRGGAVIVSHDRELLEEMDAIVELTSLGAARYGGAYSAYRARKAEELQAADRDLADAEKALAETGRRAQQAAERKARRDSAGQKSRAEGGKPRIAMDAARERAETSRGADSRVRGARRDEAQDALKAARKKIEILQPLRMEIASTRLPPAKSVLRLDTVTFGYDPSKPAVRNFSLFITGPERIGITGENGSGKTTLLALITGGLAPQSGIVVLNTPFALLDQHVSLLDPELSLRDNFLRLNRNANDNQCRAALARFQFRANDALRRAGDLSSGQKLRAGLASVLGRPDPPQLLILDEPTNHLDLDSIEALESALAAYDGALLVVSHDETFLERLNLDRRLALRS